MMAAAPSISFRPMAADDIPTVLDIERRTYPQPWSEGIFLDELSQPGRIYLVAEIEGEMIGFAGLMLVEDDAHVTTLAVDTVARQRGVGTRLMLELIAAGLERGARNLTLEVRATNEGAQRLYNRFGLAAVGVRKHYYRDDDAVIMWATDIDHPEYGERLGQIRALVEEQR
jgi:ribosomal-protein-alanine N-acetyltransferase